MTIVFKTLLFLTIPLAAVGNPLDEINRLEPQRNPLLAPLSNLKLSEIESTQSIAQQIYQVFQIKNDLRNDNDWLDLLLKRQALPLDPDAPTSEDEIQLKLIDQVKQNFSRIHFERINLDEGLPSKEDAEWAIREIEEIAKETATQMKLLMTKELLSQFNTIISSQESNVRLNLYYTIPTNVHNAIVDEINDLYKWKGDVFGDYPFDIATPFEEAIEEFEETQYTNAKNVFSLFRAPASFIRIETKYLFYLSQISTNVNFEVLVARMEFLFNLLAKLSVAHGLPDEMNEIFNSLLLHLDNILNEKELEDNSFTPIFNKLMSKILQSYNKYVSPETSFKHASTIIGLTTRLSMSHISEFTKDYYKSHDLPMLSSNSVPQNSQELLRIIDVFTSLTWTDINETWWSYILTIFDKIIGVERKTLILNAYSKIIMMVTHTPIQGSQEFYQTLYSALLNFLESEGNSIELDEWNDKFDKYLNEEYEKNQLVRKYYFPIKIQNVYSTNHEIPYDLVFLPFAPDQESADQVRIVLIQGNLDKIKSLAWNGYGRWSNDKKKSSLDKNVFILKLSGATLSSEFFQKGSFVSVSHLVGKQKARTTKPTTIRKNTPIRGNLSQLLKSESKTGSTNKIQIDNPISQNDQSWLQLQSSSKELNLIQEQVELKPELFPKTENKIQESRVSNEIEVPSLEIERQNLESDFNQKQKISASKKKPSIYPDSRSIDENPSSNLEALFSDAINDIPLEEFNVDGYELPHLVRQPAYISKKVQSNETSKKDELPQSPSEVQDMNVDNWQSKTLREVPRSQTEGNLVTELKGILRDNERKILESENLEEILKNLGVYVDDEGNEITFTMVKIVENTTPCYQALILG